MGSPHTHEKRVFFNFLIKFQVIRDAGSDAALLNLLIVFRDV
jgi:hypothetical protein